MIRLRRLAGQFGGFSPANRRKAMTACTQSVTMFGSELWWKCDQNQGTTGQGDGLQPLFNQGLATTSCFWTTNLGVLPMDSRLRLTAAQWGGGRRRLGLRLLSLPQGGQVREVVCSPTAVGKGLETALRYSGGMESTVLR